MQNFFSELDKLAAVGSYYIAASALLIALLTFIISLWAIYGTLRVFKEQKLTEILRREEEVLQRKNAEAFDIFKIITGIKDLKIEGDQKSVMTAHHSAALVALRAHPEFHDALLVQKQYFEVLPQNAHNIWMRAQIEATIQYWKTYEYNKFRRYALIDYNEIVLRIESARAGTRK